MHLKSLISDDPSAASSSMKSHVVSRIHKAQLHAFELYKLLSSPESGRTDKDLLESVAYATSLLGAESFEKSHWQAALTAFATARIIYSVLAATTKVDIYKEQLTSTIDPSVRYSAYQLQLPRDMDIASISRQHFPKELYPAATASLESLDSTVFSAPTTSADAGTVTTITWRAHTTPIEEADISVSLSLAQTTESQFSAENPDSIDPILAAYADVIDTVRKHIDELTAASTPASHPKFQSLQIIYTSTNNSLITWRIRRNKQLIDNILKQSPQRTAQITQAVALYDAILQSVEQIKTLPGVPADDEFMKELNAQSSFFSAHRTASIATSHALIGNVKNALALYARAHEHATTALSGLPAADAAAGQELVETLTGEVARWRALAEIETLSAAQKQKIGEGEVLLERLDIYPDQKEVWKEPGVVMWPPRLVPVPVKPLFLDVAWNFVDYPGVKAKVEDQKREEEEAATKKGLLGRLWGR